MGIEAVDGSKRPSSIMGAGNMRERDGRGDKHTAGLCSTRGCESSHQQASPRLRGRGGVFNRGGGGDDDDDDGCRRSAGGDEYVANGR